MASIKLFFFSLFLLFFLGLLTNGEICRDVTCGDVLVDFPFRLTDQPDCCGNPNFNLSCRSRNQLQDQTIITFPFSGEFIVRIISYTPPNLLISDPCIPKRLLQGLDLSGTPYEPRYPESYLFFNCSSNVTMGYPAIRFSCLSNTNVSVWAIPTIIYIQSSSLGSCLEISKILVPLSTPDWPRHHMDDILLTWGEPDCQSSCNYCESHGSNCQLENSDGVDDGCSYHFKKKSRMFQIKPCYLDDMPFFFLKARICYDRRHQSNVEISSLAAEHQLADRTVNGLDGPRIEAYPITLFGESCRLPRPNDNICSICLSEYQAKETIKTIPDCNHYFHANCIDEWLKLNAACPVCRNTPDQESALITHSTFSTSLPTPP
ncbi:putative RING-H2 finger protein ATL21A [Durio zibethinus]|uniref:RING-type E3 ubiquitin transferase n=1 Tax=Durio zibethinus TaxID=66656 RepID=A0A6P5Y9U8_DURZI|nr:putative RING-H2 finger protein ATL21A [Durio zibethinus]